MFIAKCQVFNFSLGLQNVFCSTLVFMAKSTTPIINCQIGKGNFTPKKLFILFF